MKKIVFILFMLIPFIVFSQNDVQLAFDYFNAQEYDKSEISFEKLYRENKSFFYYEYYVRSLVSQMKFKDAEKQIQKDSKKDPQNINFLVMLGYTYRAWDKNDLADQTFKQVLQQLPQNENAIIEVGSRLTGIKEYDWAEQFYKKANTLFPGKFIENLGVLYNLKRDYPNMINTYMDFLISDSKNLALVRQVFLNNLQNNDANNEFSNALEKSLLQRLQKQQNIETEDMLIWFYTQKTQFDKALVYALALDKRQNNPSRTFNIGVNAFDNEDFATSNSAFTFVKTFGEISPYYLKAQTFLLQTMYNQVISGQIIDSLQILKIEKEYMDFIAKNNINSVIDAVLDLVHLQAFYLKKESAAIDLINNVLKSNVATNYKTQLMLEQGDIYLHAQKIWDAILVYATIENQFPSLEIADQAKFNKAKAYFYLHHFKWAQDQWDILKGSPSKLTANDAIYWSYFIDENTDADSTYETLKAYANADFDAFCGNNTKAQLTIDTILKKFGTEPIVPYTLFLQAQIFISQNQFQNAAKSLETIVSGYSYSNVADKAAYKLAKLYEKQLNDKLKAADMYKKIMFDFPGSFYSDEARNNYRELTGN